MSEGAYSTPSHLVLIGHPVSHSLSPLMQQAAIDAAGIAANYIARDTPPDELDQTLRTLAAARAAGNVTIPHKEAVAAACTRLTPLAQRVGAVNTFWHDDHGDLIGHNTDVAGVLAAIHTLMSDRSVFTHRDSRALRVALLGAGGSAAAVMVALAELKNVRVSIAARTPERAANLAHNYGGEAIVSANVLSAVNTADLVINATPIGLHDDQMPVDPGLLPRGCAVLDLVYRKGATNWVRRCRALGHNAEDGLRVLVEQGAEAFRCWFGIAPDRSAMWSALGIDSREADGGRKSQQLLQQVQQRQQRETQ